MWLAGVKRYMARGAQIGFHAAYNKDTKQEIGQANAVIGGYMARLGYDYPTIIFATKASPQRLQLCLPLSPLHRSLLQGTR